jgi:formylglycine-generating enzyme required for sulfatase activity
VRKYALVIGIGRYADPEITDLSFAAQDAREVHRCLAENCGFDEARLLVTGGEVEPDHVGIVDALDNLAPLVCPGDLLLFYFAGHGIQTRTGAHLLASNSRIRMPELASVSMRVLQDCLSRIESSDRILILDACRNDPHKGMGDQDNLLTEGFSRDVMAMAGTAVEGQVPATCVLFSCSEGERAYEWPDQGHGAFTHYLLEGMRGGAVDDRGRLTVQALGRYVEQRVPRWAQKVRTPRPQRPWAQQLGSLRDIVLAEAASDRHALWPVLGPHSRVKCPLCGLRNDAEETFECQVCGRDYLCLGHFVKDRRCCEECAERLAAEEERARVKAEVQREADEARRADVARIAEEQLRVTEEAERERRAFEAACKAAKLRRAQAFFPMTAEQAKVVQRVAGEAFGVPLTRELDCGEGVKLPLILIPAGRFLMGSSKNEADRSNDEGPQHEVTISRPFYIGTFPVTQAQYRAITGENPSFFKSATNPVENVDWDAASRFCVRLTEKTGRAVCLPTEAQWEYACRGGSAARFSFGDGDGGLALHGWYEVNSEGKTHPVGQKKANGWGLHDMHGNVWEWCADWYGPYGKEEDVDPKGAGSGSSRVVRGGSWYYYPWFCRSATRSNNYPVNRYSHLGFRVVYSFEA